ncbi:MAG: LysR family transcriptional regulator [Alphaproteobacteria bacterium]|nr:LysR family transcriptional regulator [Alphaproteobacteria bacterium]
MDRHQAMATFVRVVETGSFSAAARLLRVGQPAVSKSVAALEERLGVRLLVRSTRRLQPTDAGQAYYERAVRALAEADEAEVAARGLGRGLEGRLRVCAPVTFARLHIAPKLGAFFARYPKLALDFVMDDRSIDLLSENIDVALRLGALPDSSLSARRLASTARVVVASPGYLEARGAPKRPVDLLQYDAIVYSQAVGGDEWRFRKGTSETSVRVPSRLNVSAAEGVREAVLAGLGLAIVSRWMMAPELGSGAVVPVLQDWSLPDIDLWAVFPEGRLPSARARAFVDWCSDAIER